jgi:hypothetical protein
VSAAGVAPPQGGLLASGAAMLGQGDPDVRFQSELVGLLPHMRAFARSLTGNAAEADDLAQEAMLSAWRACKLLHGQQHEGLDLQDPTQPVSI